MGKIEGSATAEINAPLERCYEHAADVDRIAEWQGGVQKVEVLERDEQGRVLEARISNDAKVRTVSYTLRYRYEEPHRITWDYLEGDIKDIDGEFVLEDLGDGRTLATYSLALDPGVWLPGKLAKVLNEQVMRGSVEDLKKRVEG